MLSFVIVAIAEREGAGSPPRRLRLDSQALILKPVINSLWPLACFERHIKPFVPR